MGVDLDPTIRAGFSATELIGSTVSRMSALVSKRIYHALSMRADSVGRHRRMVEKKPNAITWSSISSGRFKRG